MLRNGRRRICHYSILSRMGTTSSRSFRHHRIPSPISSPNQGRSLSVGRRQGRTARPLFRRRLRPRGRPERSSRRLQLRGRPERSSRRPHQGRPGHSCRRRTVLSPAFALSSSVLSCLAGLRENKLSCDRGGHAAWPPPAQEVASSKAHIPTLARGRLEEACSCGIATPDVIDSQGAGCATARLAHRLSRDRLDLAPAMTDLSTAPGSSGVRRGYPSTLRREQQCWPLLQSGHIREPLLPLARPP
jgi:hypothetical protein